ncbi:synaptobrevin homolog YKT6 [Caerostris extrusa]|uniref:Synaptobrevin homolog YKT6 n=1 Tax=Caerostris extrusa TaxID=172846 RepID=A0AAV4MQH4_CAEEX|nr:synaptobrevin homolog YKT6 [Caerostris extrusa]
MVKLYHLAVLYKQQSKAVSLCSANDLSSFGFFQRSSVKEFMNFSSQILTERCSPAAKISVKEQAYMCHVYVRADNLAAAVISDQEYPQRVAHTLLIKVLEEFSNKFSPSSWSGEPKQVCFDIFMYMLFVLKNCFIS